MEFTLRYIHSAITIHVLSVRIVSRIIRCSLIVEGNKIRRAPSRPRALPPARPPARAPARPPARPPGRPPAIHHHTLAYLRCVIPRAAPDSSRYFSAGRSSGLRAQARFNFPSSPTKRPATDRHSCGCFSCFRSLNTCTQRLLLSFSVSPVILETINLPT